MMEICDMKVIICKQRVMNSQLTLISCGLW